MLRGLARREKIWACPGKICSSGHFHPGSNGDSGCKKNLSITGTVPAARRRKMTAPTVECLNMPVKSVNSKRYFNDALFFVMA
jgi:hypothetical protein